MASSSAKADDPVTTTISIKRTVKSQSHEDWIARFRGQ